MLIQKTLKFDDVALKMQGDAGTFEGYASKWDGVDSYGDTIIKGAFSESLKNHGMPKLFFNHQWTMPIGKWISAEEDGAGLFVRGELTPGLAVAGGGLPGAGCGHPGLKKTKPPPGQACGGVVWGGVALIS